jgi:hypothetical protein
MYLAVVVCLYHTHLSTGGRKMNVTKGKNVRVEVRGATDVYSQVMRMLKKANKLGIPVWCRFNGILLIAKPGMRSQAIINEWDKRSQRARRREAKKA